jgi:hypothetical protein
MISHRDILTALAMEIQASTEIAEYCQQHFGQALAINVGAYASGIPDESQSPFLWIHAADDENESVGSEDTFTARLVVAGCVKGADGEQHIENVVVERSASVNGLTINGGNKIVEDLRDMIISIVRDAHAGAYPVRIRRDENDISHFPLEWAVVYVEYNEPEALN